MALSRDIQELLALLKDSTTLNRMQRFLAERNLRRTAASWKELIDDRIAPALDKVRLVEMICSISCVKAKSMGSSMFSFIERRKLLH